MLSTGCLPKHILNNYLIQLVYFKSYSKKYKERGKEMERNRTVLSATTVGV